MKRGSEVAGFVGKGMRMEGKLVFDGSVRIEGHSPCRVIGDINTPNLLMDEGVVFEGNCVMTKTGAPVEQRAVEKVGL